MPGVKLKEKEDVSAEEMTGSPKKEAVVVVSKGDRAVEGTRIKMNAMEVLFGFVKKVRDDCDFMSDDNTMVMIMPSEEGDTQWLENKVFKYVSIVQSSMSKADIQRKIEGLYEAYKKADGTPDKVGLGIVRRHLDKYYLIQRFASVFVRDSNGKSS